MKLHYIKWDNFRPKGPLCYIDFFIQHYPKDFTLYMAKANLQIKGFKVTRNGNTKFLLDEKKYVCFILPYLILWNNWKYFAWISRFSWKKNLYKNICVSNIIVFISGLCEAFIWTQNSPLILEWREGRDSYIVIVI